MNSKKTRVHVISYTFTVPVARTRAAAARMSMCRKTDTQEDMVQCLAGDGRDETRDAHSQVTQRGYAWRAQQSSAAESGAIYKEVVRSTTPRRRRGGATGCTPQVCWTTRSARTRRAGSLTPGPS